jgi:transcription antitermination factor NusG
MATHKPVNVEELQGKLEITCDRKWLVARTKPRREKRLATYAREIGIDYYLPLQNSEKIYLRRKVIFTKPLFPGYVFVHCNPVEKRNLLVTGHIAHFLTVWNEQELIADLKQIHQGKTKGAAFKKTTFLMEGTKVRIIDGPFEGLTGFVADQNNLNEVVLQINLLREAVAVTVNPECIQVLK